MLGCFGMGQGCDLGLERAERGDVIHDGVKEKKWGLIGPGQNKES